MNPVRVFHEGWRGIEVSQGTRLSEIPVPPGSLRGVDFRYGGIRSASPRQTAGPAPAAAAAFRGDLAAWALLLEGGRGIIGGDGRRSVIWTQGG